MAWTIMASSVLLPKMPSNGYFCQDSKYGIEDCRPFSYVNIKDLVLLTNLIIGTISLHSIIGSAIGFLGGLIVYLIRGRVLRKL
ncbi:MAG: hypothetical protein AAB443_03140 [Patescibacteria group bacterium]